MTKETDELGEWDVTELPNGVKIRTQTAAQESALQKTLKAQAAAAAAIVVADTKLERDAIVAIKAKFKATGEV